MGLWSFSPPTPNKEEEKEKEEKKSSDDQIRCVVLRRDLINRILTLIGHAASYAFCPNRGDPPTIQKCRCEIINSIHQVNVEVTGEPEILNLRDKLKSGDIAH